MFFITPLRSRVWVFWFFFVAQIGPSASFIILFLHSIWTGSEIFTILNFTINKKINSAKILMVFMCLQKIPMFLTVSKITKFVKLLMKWMEIERTHFLYEPGV